MNEYITDYLSCPACEAPNMCRRGMTFHCEQCGHVVQSTPISSVPIEQMTGDQLVDRIVGRLNWLTVQVQANSLGYTLGQCAVCSGALRRSYSGQFLYCKDCGEVTDYKERDDDDDQS